MKNSTKRKKKKQRTTFSPRFSAAALFNNLLRILALHFHTNQILMQKKIKKIKKNSSFMCLVSTRRFQPTEVYRHSWSSASEEVINYYHTKNLKFHVAIDEEDRKFINKRKTAEWFACVWIHIWSQKVQVFLKSSNYVMDEGPPFLSARQPYWCRSKLSLTVTKMHNFKIILALRSCLLARIWVREWE